MNDPQAVLHVDNRPYKSIPMRNLFNFIYIWNDIEYAIFSKITLLGLLLANYQIT